MNQKGFVNILFILGLLVLTGLIIGGTYFYKEIVLKKANQKPENSPANINRSQLEPNTASSLSSDWLDYNNTKFGFTFSYPNYLEIEDKEISIEITKIDFIAKEERGYTIQDLRGATKITIYVYKTSKDEFNEIYSMNELSSKIINIKDVIGSNKIVKIRNAYGFGAVRAFNYIRNTLPGDPNHPTVAVGTFVELSDVILIFESRGEARTLLDSVLETLKILEGDLESQKDDIRLRDLANLQQAINVSIQESTSSGATILCVKTRNYPCSGSSTLDSRAVDGTGWVKVNLTESRAINIPTLPVDPVNSSGVSGFHYIYCAENDLWEINAVLSSEKYKNLMNRDGGDDDNKYELGSSVNLVGKAQRCQY